MSATFPAVAGWPLSGTADPAEAAAAFDRLQLPDSAGEDLCPWPDPASLAAAVQDGTLTLFEGTGTARALYVTRAALAALPDGDHDGLRPRASVRLEARRALMRLLISSFTAFIAGADTGHLAAVAAFRVKDGTQVPSGLGGTVPGESLVLALWDEVREPVLEAAAAWEAENADPAGTRWPGENY